MLNIWTLLIYIMHRHECWMSTFFPPGYLLWEPSWAETKQLILVCTLWSHFSQNAHKKGIRGKLSHVLLIHPKIKFNLTKKVLGKQAGHNYGKQSLWAEERRRRNWHLQLSRQKKLTKSTPNKIRTWNTQREKKWLFRLLVLPGRCQSITLKVKRIKTAKNANGPKEETLEKSSFASYAKSFGILNKWALWKDMAAVTWMMSSILLLFNSWGFFSFARGATTQRLFQAKASLKVETMFVSLYPIRHSRSSILPSGISWLNSPTIPSRCAGSALALTWRTNRFSVMKK